MVQFEYDGVKKRYNVIVPFTLKNETTNVTVASISEDNKITMHRELRIEVIRQILMQWDEHSHQLEMKDKREAGEFDELFNDKNSKLTYLEDRLQIPGRKERTDAWKEIPIKQGGVDNYLDFSIRTWNILWAAGIKTVGELVEKSGRDIRRLKNCGRKSLAEIEERLSEIGLTLK